MMLILTYTDEEAKMDEAERVSQNGREDIVEATCETDDQ